MESDILEFCNLNFRGLQKNKILSNPDFQHITTVGAEFIIEANKNTKFKNLINNSIATFDGQVPYLIAKHKNKNIAFEKISGADLIYDICDKAKKEKRKIYLIGGTKESNSESVQKMRNAGIEAKGYFTGFIPYPFPKERLDPILEEIKEFKPDYLLVGLGMGKQEYLISENKSFLEKCGVKLAMGCGGAFEVFSGEIHRAPKFMQKIGLEGLYRLIKDPTFKRFKRLVSTIKFLKYI